MSNDDKTTVQPSASEVAAGAPGSDPYDDKLRAWCQRMGVKHPDDPLPVELFIEPDSELDDTIDSEVQDDGVHVDLFDLTGWRERYKIADLRALVAKHGKLATWDDFARLGDLESTDVE